jgi:hypothetical protein
VQSAIFAMGAVKILKNAEESHKRYQNAEMLSAESLGA